MRLPRRARHPAAILAFALLGACSGSAPSRGDVGAGLMTQEAPQVRPPTRDELAATRRRLPRDQKVYGHHSFFWTRAVYTSGGRGGFFGRRRGSAWATDFPKGDQQFLIVLKRLVRLDAYDWENAVDLADPELRRFPVLYGVEVGQMVLTDEEVLGLRNYLLAGGFLIVDDFWGYEEWAQFEYNISRVLPDRPIVDLPMDHPIFSAFYDIEEIRQVPNIGNARSGGPTYERYDAQTPYVRGIMDENGELMVVINFNTDLGDAWEWAEDPGYPLVYSTFAYEMGANMIVYGMSH